MDERHEYHGAEQERHWLKEPEELDDILQFLSSSLNFEQND